MKQRDESEGERERNLAMCHMFQNTDDVDISQGEC